MQRALDGGCDSIEHGLELDDAAVAQMVKQGTWLCATISPLLQRTGRPRARRRGGATRQRAEVHGPSFRRGGEGRGEDRLRHGRGRLPWSEPMAQEFPRMVEFGMTPMAGDPVGDLACRGDAGA